jgi:hypothetical protein
MSATNHTAKIGRKASMSIAIKPSAIRREHD